MLVYIHKSVFINKSLTKVFSWEFLGIHVTNVVPLVGACRSTRRKGNSRAGECPPTPSWARRGSDTSGSEEETPNSEH